jgi:hypothetical protein
MVVEVVQKHIWGHLMVEQHANAECPQWYREIDEGWWRACQQFLVKRWLDVMIDCILQNKKSR